MLKTGTMKNILLIYFSTELKARQLFHAEVYAGKTALHTIIYDNVHSKE